MSASATATPTRTAEQDISAERGAQDFEGVANDFMHQLDRTLAESREAGGRNLPPDEARRIGRGPLTLFIGDQSRTAEAKAWDQADRRITDELSADGTKIQKFA